MCKHVRFLRCARLHRNQGQPEGPKQAFPAIFYLVNTNRTPLKGPPPPPPSLPPSPSLSKASLKLSIVLQAGEKLALQDTTKGDVVKQLVPLIDNFEAAKNAIKVQSDAEQKIVDSYQVRAPCLRLHRVSMQRR